VVLKMDKTTRGFVAGSSKIMILSILYNQENYGYEIIKKVRALTNNCMEWKDGMLYPFLHKLEKEKLISSRLMSTENDKKRIYYKITEKGITELKKEIEHWEIIDSSLRKLWKAVYVRC
jgi:PadR family transcriptional regulator, regulatory protein PadR